MNRLLLFILAVMMAFGVSAQQMVIEGFRLNISDQTANNEDTKVIDDNGNPCALLKIETTQKGFTFEGGTVGIARVDESQAGEIWVYVPASLSRITIKHPQLGVLRDYAFENVKLQPARVYVMRLVSGSVQTVVNQKSTSQFFVLTFDPADAMVEIDGVMVETYDGTYSKKLSHGKHEFRISMNNYHPEAGYVMIGTERVDKFVKLNPAFGWIEVKCPSGASVYIDNHKVGIAPMKSEPIASGRHDVRVTQEMYLPYREQLIVNDNAVTTVNPSLTANYVTVNLVSGSGVEIFVDGEKKGIDSVAVDLEPGEYTFETRKKYHRSQSIVRNITMASGGTIDLPNPVAITGTLEVNVNPVGARIMLDGIDMGDSPRLLENVLIGTHYVVLNKNGYTERRETVQIEEGQTVEVKGNLKADSVEQKLEEKPVIQPVVNTEYKLGFQGMVDLNSNFSATHGGVGVDIVLGSRLKPFYHIGGGLGVHSLLNTNTKDYNVFATVYFNNVFYIPTSGKVFPMFDCAIGCSFGWLGISQDYKTTIFGLYAKAGAGIEMRHFNISAGYELIGTHTGYVKLGINF